MHDRCQSERRPGGGGQSLFLSQLERTQLTLKNWTLNTDRGSQQSPLFRSKCCCLELSHLNPSGKSEWATASSLSLLLSWHGY